MIFSAECHHFNFCHAANCCVKKISVLRRPTCHNTYLPGTSTSMLYFVAIYSLTIYYCPSMLRLATLRMFDRIYYVCDERSIRMITSCFVVSKMICEIRDTMHVQNLLKKSLQKRLDVSLAHQRGLGSRTLLIISAKNSGIAKWQSHC